MKLALESNAQRPRSLSSPLPPQQRDRCCKGWSPELTVRVVEGQTYNALAAADAAIVSSGTATVEAALLDVPMVVVYRVTPLTALLAKPLVRTSYFSMVNLIAERRVVPELIQKDFTPERVSMEVLRLLGDRSRARRTPSRAWQKSAIASVPPEPSTAPPTPFSTLLETSRRRLRGNA